MLRTAQYSAALRHELRERAVALAKAHPELPHHESYGQAPVIAWEPCPAGHGNFHPASYAAILADREWSRRLLKRHAQARRSLPQNDRGFWCELDSCHSSDALLMNIFCHPRAFSGGLAGMLGLDAPEPARFGVRARVPLANGNQDATELDMTLGLLPHPLHVEAKLTESDFQAKPLETFDRYRDFRAVFSVRALPRHGDLLDGYQLVRNVLAAHARQASFCVLLDHRRPDLLEQCYAVFQAVKPVDLRTRCKVLTWRELAQVLPRELRDWLAGKYGI